MQSSGLIAGMSLTLITGPAKCGKTSAAVETILKYPTIDWTSAVRYVVPTAEAKLRVEEAILARMGGAGILGNVVCTFLT